MAYRVVVCLLLSALAWGQAASPTSAPPAQAPGAAAEAKPEEPNVPPDTVVLTINGVCDKGAAAGSDCKTTITRAEFEKVINAIQPDGMAPFARKQFATRYAMGIVMANKAHEMGLDSGPKFDELMKLARMQVLNQELGQQLQEKANQISDQDIEDYYNKNKAAYEETALQRLFIPRTKQVEPAKDKVKLTEAEQQKREAAGEAAMKTEAEALHKRAAAGEDIFKLQEEAFTFAGMKAKPPSSNMGKVRRTALPPGHVSVLDLKSGGVSTLISDPTGYYVYKVGEKDTLPLDKVKTEIHNALRSQRMQDAMQTLQQQAQPDLNATYFAVPEGAPQPGQMPIPPGGMNMHPKPPAKPTTEPK